jgi:iron(III) transport system ATP-binding protein
VSGDLRVVELHKAYGTHPVLRGLDLEVPEGSLTAILGSSGSGKTTLLRILAGFERPDHGTISIGGRLVDDGRTHLGPQGRGVGYVPQEGALFPHLDVAANIGFGLRRRRRQARVEELLELTGLGQMAHRYPHALSGGQQQRVALARALATQPRLMLLDEPFSSLDAALRVSVRTEVARLLEAAGTTAVLVTHDQDEALSLADGVAVLRHGRFVQSGPPDQVYGRPVDADVAAFVGDANLLAGRAEGSSAVTALGRVRLVADEAAGTGLLVLVRPEQIVLVGPETPGGTPGTVLRCDYHGHDTVLSVEVVATADRHRSTPAAVQIRVAGESRLQPGAPVTLAVGAAVVAGPAGDPSARPSR